MPHPAGAVDVLVFPENMTVAVGESISLPCMASGTPLPDITWDMGGRMLTSGDYNITQSNFSNTTSHFTLSVLHLCALQLPDTGRYSCTATNTLSQGTSTDAVTFMIEVQGTVGLAECPWPTIISFL